MDAKENVKMVQRQDVFICHSINIQKPTHQETVGKPFITPRYKKPENSSTLGRIPQKKQHKSYGASLLVHRPYGLDV
mgnify:CR=1 FL=1